MVNDSQGLVWKDKIEASNHLYDIWRKEYKVDALERYYQGFQWSDNTDNPYVINLFYSTIETKMPQLIFDNPDFHVKPKPQEIDIDPDLAFEVAVNFQDAINDWVQNEDNKFQDEMEAALFDAWFRFGVIETGYSTDWVDNPKAGKPLLRSDSTRDFNENRNVIRQPEKLPRNEQIFAKYIPADQFRVSVDGKRFLHQCDWVGYWEYMRIADLRAHPQISSQLDIPYVGFHSLEHSIISYGQDSKDPLLASGDYIKCWKIWDNRRKEKLYISDTHNIILYDAKWKIFPFEEIRFRKPRKGFYPLPVTFNWISPQNEINETREMHRTHRRRLKRLYQVPENSVDREELAKVVNGPDGGIIETKIRDAIQPIPNADLGASATISMQTSKDDFNIISGTSAEQRGQADRVTATAATITNQRAQIRESREKVVVANFFKRVAKKILLIMKDKLINPMTVNSTRQEDEEIIGEISEKRPTSRRINPLTDFGPDNFEFDVDISIGTTSPVANEEELQKLLKFMAIITQFPQLAMSPTLIREVAYRTGYRNERVIKAMQQMAMLSQFGQMEMGLKNMGMPPMEGGNLPQQTVAANTPPSMEEVRNQLDNQGFPTNQLQ